MPLNSLEMEFKVHRSEGFQVLWLELLVSRPGISRFGFEGSLALSSQGGRTFRTSQFLRWALHYIQLWMPPTETLGMDGAFHEITGHHRKADTASSQEAVSTAAENGTHFLELTYAQGLLEPA